MLTLRKVFSFSVPAAHIYPFVIYLLFASYPYSALLTVFAVFLLEFVFERVSSRSKSSLSYFPFQNSIASLYVCFFSQLLYIIYFGNEYMAVQDNLVQQVFLMMLVGVVNGIIGFNIAHELIHRNSKVAKTFAVLLLMTMSKPSFLIEHLYGHHKDVATPKDPSSAPRGRGFYIFFVRTFFLNPYKAWQIAFRKAHSEHFLSSKVFYLLFIYTVMAAILLGIYWFVGWPMLVYFLGQSLFALVTLELTNYIQHYGLERQKLPSGKYESFASQHAWESQNTFLTLLLVNLPRHADHHMRPAKRYQTLLSIDSSPKLPFGYLESFFFGTSSPSVELLDG